MIGILYIVTGLAVEFMYDMMTGAMLGMTTPIFTISSFVLAPLVSVGPSLLLFTGITTLVPHLPRWKMCLTAGGIFVAALAAWSVPRIGWLYAGWLILEPAFVSLLIATLIVLLLKRRWILALMGSALSSPLSLPGSGYVLYRHIIEGHPFALSEVTLIVPGTLVIASFISCLYFKDSPR
ncbi:MAG: hypothetical protein ACRD4Y_15780 [Candidatus Acidiferrales bacterium]